MMKDRRWTVCRGDAKQSVIPRHLSSRRKTPDVCRMCAACSTAALQHCSTAAPCPDHNSPPLHCRAGWCWCWLTGEFRVKMAENVQLIPASLDLNLWTHIPYT